MQLNGFINEAPLGMGAIHMCMLMCCNISKLCSEDYFDIVILDPPTFSNSRRMDEFLDIQRDHAKLINDCLKGLKKNGVFVFQHQLQEIYT